MRLRLERDRLQLGPSQSRTLVLPSPRRLLVAALLDELINNTTAFLATPYALDVGLALVAAGLIIGLTRKGFTYHKGALIPRDMGPRWEAFGYTTLVIGLLIFSSFTVTGTHATTTQIYYGGSPFNPRWYCLDPSQTTTQNCADTDSVTAKLAGTSTCTIPVASGSCSVITTFSTAFAGNPTLTELIFTSLPTTRIFTGTATFVQSQDVSTGTASFLTGSSNTTGTMWSAFPSAQTELFGLTKNRLNFSSTFDTLPVLHARLLTGSIAGATLFLQDSLDGASTWNNVTSCSITFGSGTGDFFTPQCGRVTANQVNGVEFRLMGGLGDGAVGDSPVFASLYLELFKQGQVWASMPMGASNTATELFGNTNNRLNFSTAFSATIVMHARILKASNNASSTLIVQDSKNGGASWSNLPGCSINFGTSTGDVWSGSCFPLAGSPANGVELRIMGYGGGANDNPVFDSIYLELDKTTSTAEFTVISLTATQSNIQCTGTGTAVPTSTNCSWSWAAEYP